MEATSSPGRFSRPAPKAREKRPGDEVVMEVSRRVWLTSTIFLLDEETWSHLGVAAITSGICCILVAYYKPISDKLERWLQLISILATGTSKKQ